MQGLGVLLIAAGYGAWYTLYQKIWGGGGSYLYWVTGSTRFQGPVTSTSQGGGNQSPGPESTGIGSLQGGGPIRNKGGQPAPRS